MHLHLQRAAHFLVHFFAVVLHNYKVKFPSYTLYLENVLSVSFHCRSFSYLWPLVFLTFSPPLSCLSFNEIRLLYFFISLPSSFSAIHVSVDIKNLVEKKKDSASTLAVNSSSHGWIYLTDYWHFRCLIIERVVNLTFNIGFTCIGWTDVRTATWLPNFLVSFGYHFFLPMVLRCESSAITVLMCEQKPYQDWWFPSYPV